jgi:hypothetical protein
MSESERPYTVEFVVVDRATSYIVNPTGSVEEEGVELPGELVSVRIYAEGEYVTEYQRGEDIGDEDYETVRIAADAAGIALESRHGTLAVPGDN